MRRPLVTWLDATLAGSGPAPSAPADRRHEVVGEASVDVSLAPAIDVFGIDGRLTNATCGVAVAR
ncbi:MAG: hypothetical protein KJ066_02260 [Acidobacteria bacterium]|nr:hypothetical protein [Acidobacteriota bacterium]